MTIVQDAARDLLLASRALVGIAARSLAAEEDVTLPQFRALVVLLRPTTVADLAAELSVHPSTATRMCDRLVHKKLIRRVPRESGDRREVVVTVTARGRSMVDRVTRRRLKDLEVIVAAVPPDQLEPMVAGMRAFSEAARGFKTVDLFAWIDSAQVREDEPA